MSNSVEDNPPTTTVAKGRCTSEPIPVAVAAGSGITGFGAAGRIHRKGLFGVSDEKPIVIVAIDSEAKVKAAIEAVAPLVKEGLICTYDTEVFTPEADAGGPAHT